MYVSAAQTVAVILHPHRASCPPPPFPKTTLVRDKAEAQSMLQRRSAAREALVEKFAGDPDEGLSEAEVLRVISSIADSNNYQAAASAPVIRMLQFLDDNFSPSSTSERFGDLSIRCAARAGGRSRAVGAAFPRGNGVWRSRPCRPPA